MNLFVVFLLSYFIGAIPFAYIMTRIITGKDIRQFGSGNVGATNAARLLGLKYGLLVAALDILKGILAVSIAKIIIPADSPRYFLLIASLLVIVGHNWSILLKFTGGKGVATSFGVLVSLYPVSLLVSLACWILLIFLTRYVSLASIVCAIITPLLILFLNRNIYDIFFVSVFALLIIYRHTPNIKRLLKGNENKLKWPGGDL